MENETKKSLYPSQNSIWHVVDNCDNHYIDIETSIDEIVEQKLQTKKFSLNMEHRIEHLESENGFLKEYISFLESHKGLGTFDDGDPFK